MMVSRKGPKDSAEDELLEGPRIEPSSFRYTSKTCRPVFPGARQKDKAPEVCMCVRARLCVYDKSQVWGARVKSEMT